MHSGSVPREREKQRADEIHSYKLLGNQCNDDVMMIKYVYTIHVCYKKHLNKAGRMHGEDPFP